MQAYNQRLWIHRDLHVVVRREVDVDAGAELEPGSRLRFQYAPQAEGGVWFETEREITFSAKMLGVAKSRGFQRHESYGNRRFQVESTITTP